MPKLRPLAPLLLLALAASSARAAGLFVPLVVQETAGVERLGSPVTSGIPLPQGRVRWTSQLRILDRSTGQPVPGRRGQEGAAVDPFGREQGDTGTGPGF